MLDEIEAAFRIHMLKRRARSLRALIAKQPHLSEDVLRWQAELDGICELLLIVDPIFVDTLRQ